MPALPTLWILDSLHKPLADTVAKFTAWSDVRYYGPDDGPPDWSIAPDVIIVSAELTTGADGLDFAAVYESACGVPLLAVAKIRSLSQAVALFRAGATDYLCLPLQEGETRERVEAAIARSVPERLDSVVVELEPLTGDLQDFSLHISPVEIPGTEPSDTVESEEDILAGLCVSAELSESPNASESLSTKADSVRIPSQPAAMGLDVPPAEPDGGEEPEPVDGLPVPRLWDELPCGLMVLDGKGEILYANQLGPNLFGYDDLAGIKPIIESARARLDAYGISHKPLPDNQWPHVQAQKSRTARSAVVSVVRQDSKRVWLYLDCLPHLHDGEVTRMTMTIVNLTGILSPLSAARITPNKPATRAKRKGRK